MPDVSGIFLPDNSAVKGPVGTVKIKSFLSSDNRNKELASALIISFVAFIISLRIFFNSKLELILATNSINKFSLFTSIKLFSLDISILLMLVATSLCLLSLIMVV